MLSPIHAHTHTHTYANTHIHTAEAQPLLKYDSWRGWMMEIRGLVVGLFENLVVRVEVEGLGEGPDVCNGADRGQETGSLKKGEFGNFSI